MRGFSHISALSELLEISASIQEPLVRHKFNGIDVVVALAFMSRIQDPVALGLGLRYTGTNLIMSYIFGIDPTLLKIN